MLKLFEKVNKKIQDLVPMTNDTDIDDIMSVEPDPQLINKYQTYESCLKMKQVCKDSFNENRKEMSIICNKYNYTQTISQHPLPINTNTKNDTIPISPITTNNTIPISTLQQMTQDNRNDIDSELYTSIINELHDGDWGLIQNTRNDCYIICNIYILYLFTRVNWDLDELLKKLTPNNISYQCLNLFQQIHKKLDNDDEFNKPAIKITNFIKVLQNRLPPNNVFCSKGQQDFWESWLLLQEHILKELNIISSLELFYIFLKYFEIF